MSRAASLTAVVTCLAAVGAVLGLPRGATAEKPPVAAPVAGTTGCAQWEVMLAPPARVAMDTKALPALGKPVVEQAPVGWEPFAFTPTGALVYRRCAK